MIPDKICSKTNKINQGLAAKLTKEISTGNFPNFLNMTSNMEYGRTCRFKIQNSLEMSRYVRLELFMENLVILSVRTGIYAHSYYLQSGENLIRGWNNASHD